MNGPGLTYVVVCRDMLDVQLLTESYIRQNKEYGEGESETIYMKEDHNADLVKAVIREPGRAIFFLLHSGYRRIKNQLSGSKNYITQTSEEFADYFALDVYNYI